ncbi:hypothetical protein PC118_g12823 [Phytophthora cactorum]|uniref:Uncharacterized protein n=1 Tax=Phytophthora cactorum TaxID=29920 RepID=A0A8T1FSH5_9STRA|nr:hypothetical protein PC118_g12823 [Phytophthora cactorum]
MISELPRTRARRLKASTVSIENQSVRPRGRTAWERAWKAQRPSEEASIAWEKSSERELTYSENVAGPPNILYSPTKSKCSWNPSSSSSHLGHARGDQISTRRANGTWKRAGEARSFAGQGGPPSDEGESLRRAGHIVQVLLRIDVVN